jgi:hypothetical protein
MPTLSGEEHSEPWEALRPFFLSVGYDLFELDLQNPGETQARGQRQLNLEDAFGAYGNRVYDPQKHTFRSHMSCYVRRF